MQFSIQYIMTEIQVGITDSEAYSETRPNNDVRKIRCKYADEPNSIGNPTERVPGYDLPRTVWTVLNRLRTGHGPKLITCTAIYFYWDLYIENFRKYGNDHVLISRFCWHSSSVSATDKTVMYRFLTKRQCPQHNTCSEAQKSTLSRRTQKCPVRIYQSELC